MEVGHDKDHREEQHDRAEVDEMQRIFCTHRARGEHQDRPDDRCTGPVNLHPWKLPQGEYDVTRNENRIRAYGGELGHRGSVEVIRSSSVIKSDNECRLKVCNGRAARSDIR